MPAGWDPSLRALLQPARVAELERGRRPGAFRRWDEAGEDGRRRGARLGGYLAWRPDYPTSKLTATDSDAVPNTPSSTRKRGFGEAETNSAAG